MPDTKTLILGHKGSIGSRYAALLTHMGTPWIGFDPIIDDGEPDWEDVDSVIIATPTAIHASGIFAAINNGVRFLCEKPLSLRLEQAIVLANASEQHNVPGFVVNNYSFVARAFGHTNSQASQIKYNYFKTGKDGLAFDCCQLIMLDNEAELQSTSPFWRLEINTHRVPYSYLELSYMHMLQAFLANKTELLWTLKDGVSMTEKTLTWIERHQ